MGGLIVRSVFSYLEKHPEVVEHLIGAAITAAIAHLLNPHADAPAADPSAAGAGA